jgi:membrane protease subunit (stomatin/prohibitin family)
MSNPPDPFEFVKQLWGQMAVPGFGLTGGTPGMAGASAPQMPSFDPKELETRLAQLKQVKQWLEMNLNVMSLQINTIEMQLAAMTGFKDASEKMFGDNSAFGDASAKTFGGSASPASGASTGAAGAAAPWMDPQAWMTYMQTQAASMQKAAGQAQKTAQQAAQKAMHDGAAAMQSASRGVTTAKAKPAAKKSARTRKST